MLLLDSLGSAVVLRLKVLSSITSCLGIVVYSAVDLYVSSINVRGDLWFQFMAGEEGVAV